MAHIIELSNRGLLRISGADRVPFLQGLVSNDVTRVSEDQAIYACLLTPQGKFLHDMFIFAGADRDSLWLEVDHTRLDDLYRRLRMYKLRSDVTLTDISDDYESHAIIGDDAADLFDLVATAPGASATWDGGMVAIDPRLAELGVRLILPAGTSFASLARIDADDADEAAYDVQRITLGVPKPGIDLQVDKTILLEANIDRLNGVDWRKGCYMGQELTARTHYRGLIKRRFYPVTLSAPSEVTEITDSQGRNVGELLSQHGQLAIAKLKISAAESGDTLTAGDAVLTVKNPPGEVREAG